MADTNKEINLDSQVESDLPNVRKIIARSLVPSPEDETKSSSLYSAIIEEFSEGTRSTPAQISYLDAYEKASTVFRAASLELRKSMDVLTLEQRLAAHLRCPVESISAHLSPELISGGVSELGQQKNQIRDLYFWVQSG